ncbi:Outer membrane cobalamin receptor protein, SusC/RagA family [Bacteroidales bacterium Barb6XT]|nr:Outer membrane cobalamin receptor protein, SusC/RagA family [Bacteroidales bacterium Barb6XT]
MKNYITKGFIALLCICVGIGDVNAAATGSLPAASQQAGALVKGIITDESGEPVIGANVLVSGTTIGTITDFDGKFELAASAGAELKISYIGYFPQSVKVAAGKTDYNIILREDAEALDEVVVIGYGVVKKSDVTGSVVSVNSGEMLKRNPTTVGQGLQGAAAGVSVSRNSGDPRGEVTIRVRGVATVNNSADPLFVVDGIPVGTSIDFLNPNDVESIEVLKDASATAIYGSQGANGVIMITTKRGTKGSTHLTFAANYGIQTNSKTLDVLDAAGFASAARRAAASDNASLTNAAWTNSSYDSRLNSINWQDEMTRTSLQQKYDLNVSGGSENTQAVMSVGYMNNDGIIINSNFKRLTARANIDHKVKSFLRTGINLSYMHSENHGLDDNRTLSNYATLIPTMDDVDANGNLMNVPIQYPNGTWGHFKQEGSGDTNKGTDNPVAVAMVPDERASNNKVVANAYIDFDIIKGLVFKTVGGFNYAGYSSYNYAPVNNRSYTELGNPDRLSLGQNQGVTLSLESYLTYDLKINSANRIGLMAGHSLSQYTMEEMDASARNFPMPTIRRLELTKDKGTITATGGLGRELRGQSFFGRANYALLDRYLLTGTVRRDGSSNFGAGNRYGVFSSASFAWRLSEEEFIKNLNIFSNLKLRLGWGQTGNAGNSTNRSVNQLSSDAISYYFFTNGQPVLAPGLAQTKEIDTNLKWETNEQTNIGLDLGFIDNTLTFAVDYFVRDAKDLLLERSVRPSTGYSSVYTNAGHIRNSGLEVMATYQKQVGDWNYNVKLNASTLKNKVIEVGDDIFHSGGGVDNDQYFKNWSLTRNDYPIASYYGWRVDGIFQSQEEIDGLNAKAAAAGVHDGLYQSAATRPGDYKYKDINSDGYIDDKDREIFGNGFPDLNYGLNIGVSYKNWDLNLYAYGVTGQQILSYAFKELSTMRKDDEGVRNILTEVANNAWTPENHSTMYPRLTRADGNHNTQISDAFLKNGNFLRLQNIQIGYVFPKALIEPLKLANARVFASVENLFTFTSYKAGDPEIGNGNDLLETGLDSGRYPFPRAYAFGLTVGF